MVSSLPGEVKIPQQALYIYERERERERERESLLEASFLRMSLLEARIIKINRTIEVQKCMIFFAVALT